MFHVLFCEDRTSDFKLPLTHFSWFIKIAGKYWEYVVPSPSFFSIEVGFSDIWHIIDY